MIAGRRRVIRALLDQWKRAQISSHEIVQPECAIPLELFGLPEFQLRPASSRIRTLYLREGVDNRSRQQNTSPEATTQTADGPSIVEFTGQFQRPAYRDGPVGCAGPGINVSVESPYLAAVITAASDGKLTA